MRLDAVRRLWQRLVTQGEEALETESFTDSERAIGRMVLPLMADLEEARKSVDEATSRARALESALDLLPVAAIVLDEAGLFLTSNARAKALFGGPAIPATVLEAARRSASAGDERKLQVLMKREPKGSSLRIVPAAIGNEVGGPDERAGRPAIFFLVPTDGVVEVPTASLVARYGLSRSEARVVALIAQGLTNREVADRLGVSPETVHTYLKRTFEKTGINSRLALVALAFGARFGIAPSARSPDSGE
jgi:DNA-binding CsgD family transcriptional regulator